ncbi:cation transporter [Pseudorhizobium endolithicum]|uniref:Cation transporter n=1 Tax=Pseudorhizobium endolithicum TaxID=1191678 RepID=A0ABM8PC45_9HYPH|nr:FixH family protein [Pseudorhizobium endolithicum]CAD6413566.1 cation transporter [Rhizobium sp. Q54]CAD7022912.1 cation transporter [Pseudorhizobium endolithicum]
MSSTDRKGFVFTGWHMIGVMCLFFGTIISVNFYMAWQATHTWSGLVVKNTYIASQEFNGKVAEARALAASGIAGTLDIDGSDIRYRLVDASEKAVAADGVTLSFKRPVGEDQDFDLSLQPQGEGTFAARHDLAGGTWIVEVEAVKEGRRILHHTQRISVAGEAR